MQISQMTVLKAECSVRDPKASRLPAGERVPRSPLPAPPGRSHPETGRCLFGLNDALTALPVPFEVDEAVLSRKLSVLEGAGEHPLPAYWLLAARLTELTVFMAGYYADTCQVTAAGDLLVNPRTVHVHLEGRSTPVIKDRHRRLSDQINPPVRSRTERMKWLSANARAEAVATPLLPYLRDRLADSGIISGNYLRTLRERMSQIADTIGFMAAWGLSTPEGLFDRLSRASAETRAFVAANQCRFDTSLFRRLGREIQTYGTRQTINIHVERGRESR